MNAADIRTIAVIGAGDMGHGIAEVCAIAGFEVFLKDVKNEFLDRSIDRITKSLKILARKTGKKVDEAPRTRAPIDTMTLGSLATGEHD